MLQEQNTFTAESQRFVSSYLVPTTKKQTSVETTLHQVSSNSRADLERFISQKYRTTHAATLRAYMPRLVALTQESELTALIGIRGASEGTLFLEQYIDTPIESMISLHSSPTEDRKEIAEIGNFAANNIGAGSLLFTLLAQSLEKSGFKWMVFTATTEIEKMINRLGCQPTILSDANPEKIGEAAIDWGAYYQKAPRVMACNLEHTIHAAYSYKRLRTILEKYDSKTTSLARSIQLTNIQETR